MLDEVFGINYNDIPTGEERQKPEEIEVDYNDPVDILRVNIKKANFILDKIQEELINGNFTARMVEVAGAIINGITAASKEIVSKENYDKYIEVRKELAELKEREVIIKEKSGVRGATTNQNIIVTSREDLLKIMAGKQPKKIGQGSTNQKEVRQLPEKTDERN